MAVLHTACSVYVYFTTKAYSKKEKQITKINKDKQTLTQEHHRLNAEGKYKFYKILFYGLYKY